MEKITKSFLALVLMLVSMVSAQAQAQEPQAPTAPKASALVTDGSVKQYLFNVGAKGFFIGANDWGTRASFSADKGYWVKMTKSGDTYILANEAKNGNSADCQAVDQIWVDGKDRAGDGKWTITTNEDGSFKLGNTNVAGFLSVLPSKNDTRLYMSDAEEAQSVWIAVSEEDYAAYFEAIAKYKAEYAAWIKGSAKAGDDIIAAAPATWEGQSGSYAGFGAASERYNGGSIAAGDVMTQTIEGLKNGKYTVKLELAGSYTSGRGFECPTGDGLAVAFANDKEENLPIKDRGGVGQGEQDSYSFDVEVTDGTLKYGIKNLAAAGNWYVARVTSIVLTEVAPPAKDKWFTDNTFCIKDTANGISRSMDLPWAADPDDDTNGCIKLSSAANAGADHDLQFMIRGAEYDGADLTKGAFAEGEGFKVTFKVKADGNYSGCLVGWFKSEEATGKKGWNFGNYLENQTVKLDVTTEWQTVSYSYFATADDAGKFTAIGFNLADKGGVARTFYFDDVQIVRGSDWSTKTRITDKWKENGKDQNKPAEYKSEGYVEIVTVSNANTWDNQVFFQIADAAPNGKLKKNDKITLQFKAMASLDAESTSDKTEIQAGGGFHKSYDGAGWLAGTDGVTIPVGKWSDEITKEITINRDDITNYSLDLSYDSKPITYRFKDVKVTYESGVEEWTQAIKFGVKVTPFTQDPADETKWVAGDDVVNDPAYKVVDGDGMFEVVVDGKKANAWDTQFFFQIADAAPSKALKMNDKVTLKYKIKAVSETLEEGTELSLGGNLHTACGSGWFAGAPAGKAVIGKWTDIEQLFEIGDPKTTNYSMNMSADTNPITYYIDEVSVKFEEAPVLDWVELISNGDCEKDPEHVFAASKETPVDGSNVNQSRYVDSGDATHGKVIEIAAGPKESQAWDNQFWIYEPYDLPSGTSIVVEFDYKAEVAAKASTQTHTAPGAYQYWRAINDVNFTTEWLHFKFEGKVTTGDNDATVNLRSVAFNMSEFAEANKYYIDNVSFKVPAGTIDGLEPTYIDDLKKVEYIDPTTIDWSDNILKNGDLKGDDMSEFYLKNNDVEDPETLMAEKTEFGGAFEIDIETAARPAGEKEGEVGGNDHDAQFFVRLPYVLPKGTTFNLEFDLYAEEINTLAIQAHAEPGQYKGNLASVKTDPSLDAVHFQKYLKAPEDMRSIAINLAVATDATYAFSNFKVQIPNDAKAAIEEATATADASTLWAETLALNEAAFAGRNTETEGKGYTEESVKALTDAIAAGKAELKKEDATKESLAAAAKAINDAIAGLEKGKPELAYTDLTKEMFFHWNAADETAEALEASNCDYNIGTSTGQPYGLSTVNHDRFADLSAYNTIELTATEGEPRLLFNRIENEGTVFAELPRDKDKYETVVDNGDGSKTYVIDIAAIVAEYGFAHLHAIKGANWVNTTVTEIKLGYAGEKPALPIPTAIEGVETAEDAVKDGKYFINGQIVIVKNGVKYNAAGVAIQ